MAGVDALGFSGVVDIVELLSLVSFEVVFFGFPGPLVGVDLLVGRWVDGLVGTVGTTD